MKKALALLIALLVLTGAVFADSFGNEATVAVEGDATLTWGYALDGDDHGFKNAMNWKITIPLLTKQTFGTRSEGENYAEINIVDAQYNLVGDESDDPDFAGGDKEIDGMNAKLVFGNVYMTVYDKPGFKPNYAEIWAPIKNDDYFGDDKEGKTAFRFEPGFDGAGTKIGYKTETMDIGFKVASMTGYETVAAVPGTPAVYGYWDDDNNNATPMVPYLITPAVAGTEGTDAVEPANKYAFGLDVSLTPSDMISLKATFNYATWQNVVGDDGFMSVGFEALSKPMDKVEVKLAMDAGNNYKTTANTQVLEYDVLFSAKYDFVEAGAYYYSPRAIPVAAGSDADGREISDLAAYLKVTDGDKVENLDGWFTFMAYSLLSDVPTDEAIPMAIGTGASYKVAQNDVNYFKPFFELYAQNNSGLMDEMTDYALAGNVGVEYGLFTNTIVTAKYEAGATQDDLAGQMIKTAAKSTKGLITLACEITY